MMNEVAGLALSELGRRLERLLYFGSLLLLACFLQMYFVSATVYSRVEQPEDIAELILRLEADLNRLSTLYKTSVSSTKRQSADESTRQYLEIRRRLGLPKPPEKSSPKETYGDELAKISGAIAKYSSGKWAGALIDSQKSPETLLAELRQRHKELMQKPISVWGIETPPVVPVQYGTASYQVPTSFIANALMVAFAPLLIGWFGSVYMTRQRELLILRELRDHKTAFPDVLNVLPVIFSSLPLFNSRRYRKAKDQATEQLVNRISSSVVRSFILLLFVVPMLWMFAYSAQQLILPRSDASYIELIAAGAVLFCLATQAILLVVQEWILLWGKEYFA